MMMVVEFFALRHDAVVRVVGFAAVVVVELEVVVVGAEYTVDGVVGSPLVVGSTVAGATEFGAVKLEVCRCPEHFV